MYLTPLTLLIIAKIHFFIYIYTFFLPIFVHRPVPSWVGFPPPKTKQIFFSLLLVLGGVPITFFFGFGRGGGTYQLETGQRSKFGLKKI